MKLTPPSELSEWFVAEVRPAMLAVAEHPFFAGFGSVSEAQIRKALLGFYPLIESFPAWMSVVHRRLPEGDAREWYARNIRVEKRHAKWWIDCGAPFGLTRADFVSAVSPAAMAAQREFLAAIVRDGSIAEAAAALNYAVEGATGEWTRVMQKSARDRYATLGLHFKDKALRWVDAHAAYDDLHPAEALEVVKAFADNGAVAAKAAIRSLDLYRRALDELAR